MRLFRRPPDFVIGDPANPYMRRWYLIPRNRWCNVYLHHIRRSDDDRALHDHPWWFVSLILRGGYWEWTEQGRSWRRLFSLAFRRAETAHRIELDKPAWTLVITGPRIRTWGFHCPKGWIPWQKFCEPTNPGQIGRGCGET